MFSFHYDDKSSSPHLYFPSFENLKSIHFWTVELLNKKLFLCLGIALGKGSLKLQVVGMSALTVIYFNNFPANLGIWMANRNSMKLKNKTTVCLK